MSEIINTLIRINGRLDITEENIFKDVKICTSENVAVEIIQDPEIKVTKEKKKEKENPHTSMNYGITSSGQIYMQLETQRRGDRKYT